MYLSCYVYKNRFDLMEFHDYGGDAAFFLGNTPIVIRCHGSALTLYEFMGYPKRITDYSFEKRMFKRFNKHVVAVSKYSAEITQTAFKLKTMPRVIYSGVSIAEINKYYSQNYLDRPTIPYSIFYVGSVRERKGINLACHIFNKISEQFPEASFHVLGNNNNNHWNEIAVPLLTQKALCKTIYYGTIPNAQIFKYLEKAHLTIFPSYGENFSVGLLEVMSIGKIVITSKIPSFEEIIVHGENGFIAADLEDYITVISKLFESDTIYKFISTNAKNTIQTQFELKKVIKENVNYYKTLV